MTRQNSKLLEKICLPNAGGGGKVMLSNRYRSPQAIERTAATRAALRGEGFPHLSTRNTSSLPTESHRQGRTARVGSRAARRTNGGGRLDLERHHESCYGPAALTGAEHAWKRPA